MPSVVALVSVAVKTCLSSRYHATDNADMLQYFDRTEEEAVFVCFKKLSRYFAWEDRGRLN